MLPSLLIVLAAMQPPEVRTRLPDVVVTATSRAQATESLPASASSIDADPAAAAQPGIDVSEALARVPGLVVNNRRNYAQDLQIVVRGYGARSTFGVRGVRLYVNGIPASAPDGQGQIAHAALGDGTRIEVLRGPLAALYGNASGGVIRVENDPRMLPEGAGAAGSASQDFWRLAGTYAGAGERGAWRVDASHLDYDGFRPHSAARRDVLDLVARGDWTSGWSWSAVANALRAPADDPLGLDAQTFADDPDSTAAVATLFDTRKDARQQQAGFALERAAGARPGVRVAAFAGARDVVQFLAVPVGAQVPRTSAGGVIDLARSSDGLEARTWQSFGAVELTLGANLERLRETRRGYENFAGTTLGVPGALRRDERNRVDANDFLAQLDWRTGSDWLLSLGVRDSRLRYRSDDRFIAPGNPDDSGSRQFHATVPFAALRWSPNEDFAVHAAWAHGFEAPTLNEIAYRSDGSTGLNLELDPMRSQQRELGIKWRAASGVALDAAVFADDTDDEIVVVRNSGGRSAFANAARTTRRGVEAALSFELARAWSASLAYTWLDARYDDAFAVCRSAPCTVPDSTVAADSRLPGIARHFAYAELLWQPVERWRLGMEFRGADAVVVDDLATARAPGYGALALHASRSWQGPDRVLEAFVRLDNAGDRRYAGSVIVNEANGRYFEPAPGRTFTIGVVWRPRKIP